MKVRGEEKGVVKGRKGGEKRGGGGPDRSGIWHPLIRTLDNRFSAEQSRGERKKKKKKRRGRKERREKEK